MGAGVSGRVSVALSARNAADTIVAAAASILNQSHRELELFIVDDGSDDGTAEAVIAGIRDPRAVLLRLSANVGTYAAKNLVLRDFATGAFFAHQDADDTSFPDRFARQIAALGDGLDVCGTAIDEFGGTPNFRARFSEDVAPAFNPADGFWHKVNRYPARLGPEQVLDPQTGVAALKLAMNGSLMFRTACLRELGGFDGSIPVGGDTDLLIRAAMIGRVGNIPDVLYARSFHDASLTAAPATNFASPVRQGVIAALEAERTKLRALWQAGDRDGLWNAVRRELFVPPVAVAVVRLGG